MKLIVAILVLCNCDLVRSNVISIHPYIARVPQYHHVIQIAGPLQFQPTYFIPHNTTEESDGSHAPVENEDTKPEVKPEASTPQVQLMPGIIVPSGYAFARVVPFNGVVPVGTHYANVFLPAAHTPVTSADEQEMSVSEAPSGEIGNGELETVQIGPVNGEGQTRRKREETPPPAKYTFPVLTIKAPAPVPLKKS